MSIFLKWFVVIDVIFYTLQNILKKVLDKLLSVIQYLPRDEGINSLRVDRIN